MARKKAYIEFKFLKPVGFGIEGRGIFTPSQYGKSANVPQLGKPVQQIQYDFNHVFKIELKAEEPEPLPAYFDTVEESVKAHYRNSQIDEIVQNHMDNNKIRTQLAYYEEQGYIKIITDPMRPELIEAEVETPKRKARKTA